MSNYLEAWRLYSLANSGNLGHDVNPETNAIWVKILGDEGANRDSLNIQLRPLRLDLLGRRFDRASL